jgi:UDP-N-acetylmuramoyl-L-alanyl-D-glutamate--2,6-diaminopimelate ligase
MLESLLLRTPDPSSGGPSFSASDAPGLTTEPIRPEIAGGKRLGHLLGGLPQARLRGDQSLTVRDLTYRSGEVRSGSLFFCVTGARADGHQFAVEAERRGAVAIVAERSVQVSCAQVLVPSVREAMGPMSAAFFDHPSDVMTVAGVTGTNGKTTTTYLLESIFRAGGVLPGVVGTTGIRIGGRVVGFDRTTPEAPDLQRLFRRMIDQGLGAVAMEVSSHGLDQHRVDGTRYACSVFTNLSQDHLDYHGTIEAYFAAKARLFTGELSRQAAVNVDSPEGRVLADASRIPTVRFGVGAESNAEMKAVQVEVLPTGISFLLEGLRIRSRLRGAFNVYNCLGAAVAGRLLGIEDRAIAEGIAALEGVPGRLEPVDGGQPFAVLVDYAHTPDSLDNVLRAARGLTERKVIAVFGCGGDRDRTKRPLMGEAATRLADLTVITSDNPRSEDPEAIIAEIRPGAVRGGGVYVVEADRRAAIRLALAEARPGDAVVIAGKGHETGQEFRHRTVPFDDRVVAAEELSSLLGTDSR